MDFKVYDLEILEEYIEGDIMKFYVLYVIDKLEVFYEENVFQLKLIVLIDFIFDFFFGELLLVWMYFV